MLRHADSTNAGSFTNGFPKVLVTDVFRDMSSNYTLRLLPEMNFACNGTIVGFTVAGRRRERPMSPIIQIWRQNSSNVYNMTRTSIVIDEKVCADTSVIFQRSSSNGNNRVWQCKLSTMNQVPVQAGDILGLLLPPRNKLCFFSIVDCKR